jgi:hypothetical protein
MYQPYPSADQPQPLPPMTPPSSVRNAVRLMYAGAVLSAVQFVLVLLTRGSLRSAIVQAARQAHRHLTPSQIHAAEVFEIVFLVVIGIIAVGLWVWMARANAKGRSWARVVASVLFGLDTFLVLLTVARPHVGIGLGLGGLIWLVGLGAIVLLWQCASTAYYQANSARPRYT